MSIKTIVFENVQPHKETTLDLHPGLNVIKAVSDTGKSSLERAFESMVTGNPRPLDLLNWDCDPKKDSVRIAMEFDDDTWVSREQSEVVNQYETSESDKPYKSFRKSIPDGVAEVMNMDFVNVHNQDDPYFMLQNTPAEVGRMFSEAVGLEIIDVTIKEARLHLLKTKSNLKHTKKDVKSLKEVLKDYDDLDEIEPIILQIDKQFNSLNDRYTIITSLSNLILSISGAEDQIDHLNKQLKIEPEVSAYKTKLGKMEKQLKQMSSLHQLINDIEHMERSIDTLKSKIAAEQLVIHYKDKANELATRWIWIGKLRDFVGYMDNLEKEVYWLEKSVSVAEDVEALIKTAEKTASLRSDITKLSRIVEDIERAETLGYQLAESYKSALTHYLAYLEKEKICPLCTSTINKDVIKKIEKRYNI